MKKREIFWILVCFAVFAACIRPLSLKAQSGSSTCQVTATTGETATPPPADTGEGREEPSEPGTTGEPETGPSKETEEPKAGSGKEPGEPGQGEAATPEEEHREPEPESTTLSGEETGHLDTGGDSDLPGEEKEPAGKGEPVSGETQGEHDGCRRMIRWLWFTVLALCILVILSVIGAFQWLWMLLRFLLFKRKRIRFHGILTAEKNFFIRVRNVEESAGLVQDMIDNAGSFIMFKREVLKETAVTCIPGQSRMRISGSGPNGRKRVRETAASEQRLFRILGKMEGTGEVEVRITCRGTGIDIPLVFWM